MITCVSSLMRFPKSTISVPIAVNETYPSLLIYAFTVAELYGAKNAPVIVPSLFIIS